MKTDKIIGIDISDNMLSVARRHGLQNICVKNDAANTLFYENVFDVAILNFILHETQQNTAQKIISEAQRIVKNQGKIIITDYVFDKKTSVIGKAGTFLVEYIIGGSHYSNFKNYIKNKLLLNYTTDLQIASESKFVFGAVRVYTFINNKN